MSSRGRAILIALGAAVLVGVTGSESKWFTDLWQRAPLSTLIVSRNIETHESVLSFKHVQSRTVELPFDEAKI